MMPATDTGLYIIPCPAPELRVLPGQFLLGIPPALDPYLPRALFPFRIRNGIVESVIADRDVAGWNTGGGQTPALRGPYGKPFELAPQGARVLVLAQDLPAAAHLIPLIDALVVRECEVTLLCAPNDRLERLLPDEVEYRESENLVQGAPELLNWADALFACAKPPFYDQLRALAGRDRLRLERGWGQVLVRDVPMPCGTGLCYLCAFRTARGIMLNCQQGPVVDLVDWMVQR